MKTGKLAESVLKRSVLKQVHTLNQRKSPDFPVRTESGEGAVIGSDCAFFVIPNGQILAWCAQEAAVAGQADRGEMALLIQKSANNLAAAGAKPVSAQIAMMLPEGTEEELVKALMTQAAEKCGELGMSIAGGDTNVSSAVTVPIVTVTALGLAKAGKTHSLQMAHAGQDLVISKWIGLEGTAFLAENFREKLLQRYPAFLVDEAASFSSLLSVTREAQIASENGAQAMHDLSQGGVFGALWELAEGSGLGLTVDLRKIPIRQETVEVCEVCGINPYEMRSAGSLLMTTRDGEALVQALEKEGIPAALIGKLTDRQDRMILNEEEVRFLDRPRGVDSIAALLTAKD